VNTPRRLQWDLPESPPPKHPYRDTLLVYGGLAVVVVLVAWATGGKVLQAVGIALAFFVVASAWNAYRWHSKTRAAERAKAKDTL
jgi:membrane protein implicated in regulation of membrane protease activity